MRTLEEIYDYYQAAVYDRETLVDSFQERLIATEAERVLDCACGTGLPALDLRARGYSVDCSDADGLMLEQFRRNARERGVSEEAWQLRWDELSSLGRQYDFVMCRGNSLVYAESWEDGEASGASLASLERHVSEIAAVVAPGGYLLVDAPRTSELAEATYPPVIFRGERVLVKERVTSNGRYRGWEQRIVIGSDEYCFVRNSTNLTAGLLAEILARAGFASVSVVAIVGERPSYDVLVAHTPTKPTALP